MKADLALKTETSVNHASISTWINGCYKIRSESISSVVLSLYRTHWSQLRLSLYLGMSICTPERFLLNSDTLTLTFGLFSIFCLHWIYLFIYFLFITIYGIQKTKAKGWNAKGSKTPYLLVLINYDNSKGSNERLVFQGPGAPNEPNSCKSNKSCKKAFFKYLMVFEACLKWCFH